MNDQKRARPIENWSHYYKIAGSRPDLKEFKSLLEVNYNQPHVRLDLNKILTKDGVTTFKELINKLAPEDDHKDNTI